MKYRRYCSIILVLGLLAALLAGCGSAKSQASYEEAPAAAPNYKEEYYSMDAAEGAALSDTTGNGSPSTPLPQNRKFIITMNMSAETEDLDGLLESLNAKVTALNGYLEDQDVYNGSSSATRRHRTVNMTVRIPVAQLDAFLEEVQSISNVVSSSRSTEDVTLTYVDTESRIAALKTEQARLTELLEKAEDLSDLLQIEDRLTEVRYQLERYSSNLRVMDNQIDYATIRLNIDEVKEYTPVAEKTRWEKMTEGFVRSLKDIGNGILDFFTAVIIDLPYLIIYGVIIAAIVFLVKFLNKKSKASKAKKAAARYQAMQAQQQAQQAQQKKE